MKANLSFKMLGIGLFAASAVHAQTQPAGQRPQDTMPMTSAPPPTTSGPLPPVGSPQPLYGPAPAEQPEARRGFDTYKNKFMFGGSWDIGVPIGSAHSFPANTSPVGFELLGQYFVASHIAVGASLDWQTYWDTRPRST